MLSTLIFGIGGGATSADIPTGAISLAPAQSAALPSLPAGLPPDTFTPAPLAFMAPAPITSLYAGAQPPAGQTVPAGATEDCGCGAAQAATLQQSLALPIVTPTVGVSKLSWLWWIAGALLLIWLVKPKRKAAK